MIDRFYWDMPRIHYIMMEWMDGIERGRWVLYREMESPKQMKEFIKNLPKEDKKKYKGFSQSVHMKQIV